MLSLEIREITEFLHNCTIHNRSLGTKMVPKGLRPGAEVMELHEK